MTPERFHTIRVLGPYGAEADARADAMRMADIQTQAWHAWLGERGVSRQDIISTLDSDSSNEDDIDEREFRVRQSLTRNGEDAILYMGAYSTQEQMVGFAKFMVSVEEEKLLMHLAEIDVQPEYQGRQAEHPDDQNLARKLIYSAIAHVRDPQAILRLGVLGSNARARRLYEHLGLNVIDDTGVFKFYEFHGFVSSEDPYLTMEGSLQVAKHILAEDLGMV